MDGAGNPVDFSALVAITRWRRDLTAGRDPGPPPVPLPGLLRLERARRFTRHLEQSLGLDEPPPALPLQLPLSVLLSAQPACPGMAAAAPPPSPRPAARRGRELPWQQSATPVFAYRAWAIVRNRLRGVRVTWPVPTVMARCLDLGRRSGADPADVPHTDGSCGPPPCGIYATKAAADSLDAIEHDGPLALGVVALAGKVVEHERGYRAAAATAVGMLVVWEGRAVQFDGVEVDELFAVPDQALAAARDRAWALPAPGPERDALLVGQLEAIRGSFGAPAGSD
ncbi:MAG: hypothetical protein JW785_08460 [Acidimicrobiia bacterium]|nr:hypothetical protein [Acidimicrobiia bacterium]